MHHPHHHHEAGGCDEYRTLDRRRFLEAGSLSAMAAGLPSWLPEVQLAPSQNSTRDIVVSVFLRGGADGLTLVAPFADPFYYSGRPTIAVPRPDATSPNRGTALDNFFMLPPGMSALLPAYLAKAHRGVLGDPKGACMARSSAKSTGFSSCGFVPAQGVMSCLARCTTSLGAA